MIKNIRIALTTTVAIIAAFGIGYAAPADNTTRNIALDTTLQTPDETPTGDPAKAHRIVISKETMTLNLYDSEEKLICSFPVAIGKNAGNKRHVGDMKTPEGKFTVQQIQASDRWTHDFGDGKGQIKGCYGNWFIRLKTPPHKGIGIHGTHDPESIGTRATEGCIRLHNSDLDSLKPMVHVGMSVVIEAATADRIEDAKQDDVSTGNFKVAVDVKPSEGLIPAEEPVKVAAEESKATPTTPAEPKDGEVWHTVADGDLVGAIAIKYGVSTAQIKELNPDINIDRISIGQRIRIK